MDFYDPTKRSDNNTIDVRNLAHVARMKRIKEKLFERKRKQEDAKIKSLVSVKTDWTIPEEVADLLKQRHKDRRLRLLDELVPDRLCPACKEREDRPNQWVARRTPDGTYLAICKSCFFTRQPNQGFEVDLQELCEPVQDVMVDCGKLRELIVKTGLSQANFAQALDIHLIQLQRLIGYDGHLKYKMKYDLYIRLVALLTKLDCKVIEVEF